jgi:hypothetical protein
VMLMGCFCLQYFRESVEGWKFQFWD